MDRDLPRRDARHGAVVETALPALVASRGAIVTTAAYSIRAPEIARLPYASMKSAVATFTKGIAKAYGPKGVRANCVCPGAIETSALTEIRAQVSEARGIPYEEALERVMIDEWGLDVALQRSGRPAEVGALIAFLLSPVAGYMTGALLNIDGGTNSDDVTPPASAGGGARHTGASHEGWVSVSRARPRPYGRGGDPARPPTR